jgi:predicted NodU family carbamoyl transferase
MAHAPLAFDQVAAQVQESMTTDPDFTDRESFVSAVMKEIQAISTLIMERNVKRALDRFEIDPATTHLAMPSGFALNCPTNSHLMAKYGFRSLLAPPCVDDGGQAMGIGLAAFHKRTGGKPFKFSFPGPYLGRADTDLTAAAAEFAEFVEVDERAALSRETADVDYDPAFLAERARVRDELEHTPDQEVTPELRSCFRRLDDEFLRRASAAWANWRNA